jgi:hypothetical protein
MTNLDNFSLFNKNKKDKVFKMFRTARSDAFMSSNQFSKNELPINKL